ncbi:MAG: non-homologous end-joining DNA ligase [Thermoanaerobaculia bacterium]
MNARAAKGRGTPAKTGRSTLARKSGGPPASRKSPASAAPQPTRGSKAAGAGRTTAGGPPAKPAAGALQVSNPDKIYWPEEGYTKLDLIRFYDEFFPALQPWVRDRLLSLKRCPNGITGKCFFQKEKPESMPPDTPTRRIEHENGIRNYVVGGKRETQLALANLGCIAVHVWGARQQDPRKPDWVCFDLDPDSGKFAEAARAGLKIKQALDALGLKSFPKTSGKKGMHVFIPIETGPDADEAKEFAERLGHHLSAAFPKEMTMENRIAARKGRVYLDPFRNGFAQTVVAPYSVRKFPGAPVSTPLDWDEVDPKLNPRRFTIANFARRLAEGDPWKDFWKSRQKLGPALSALRAV